MTINISALANKLGKGNEFSTPHGIMTQCPCHNDNECSLLLRVTKNGDLRPKCNSGCPTKLLLKELRKELLLLEKTKKTTGQFELIAPSTKADTSSLTTSVPIVPTTPAGMLKALESIRCTSTELLKKEFTPVKIFMKPFLTAGSLIMVFAPAGVGKTWFILWIALALTRKNGRGVTLGPLDVIELCGVVILDGEMRPYQLKDRTKMFAGAMGAEHPDYPLTFITSDDMFVQYSERIDLGKTEWRDSITSYLRRTPENKVLIIDNIASLMPNIGENSKASWDDCNQWLLSLRSMDITVIIVHHSNKSGGYRGHSGRIDNLDTVMGLKSMKGPDELCFQVDYEKARGAKKGDKLGFVLEGVEHPENSEWFELKECHTEAPTVEEDSLKMDLVMAHAMLKKKPQVEIAEMLDVSQATVSNCKREAARKCFLTKEGEVTDAGREFLQQIDLDKRDEELAK